MAKQKLMLLIAVAVICIFAMAGVAVAADGPSLGSNCLIAGENPVLLGPTNVVKASHTYPLTICSSQMIAGCSIEQFTGNDICLEFEQVLEGDAADQFDLTSAIGVPVYIKVWVMCGTTPQEYYLQTIPRVDQANRKICFTVQRQNITCASGWVMGFCIEGLKIKTTHVPNMTGKSYNVTLSHKCWGTLCYDLKVVQTVGKVELTGPANCVIGGTNATVQGQVWATCTVPWDKATWPVIIEIKDKKGRQVYGPHDNSKYIPDCCDPSKMWMDTVDPCTELEPIKPVIVHTDANGFFSGQILVPACGYDWDGQKIYDFVITARVPETIDSNGLPNLVANCPDGFDGDQIDKGIEKEYWVDPALVPAEGIEDGKGLHVKRSQLEPACFPHAYLKSNSVTVTSCPGTPYTVKVKCPTDQKFNYKKPNKVTFCLVDKFGRETVATSAVELKLWSWQNGDCTKVGGVYKNGMDAPGFPATVIDKAWIMPGQKCIDVYFYPDAKPLSPSVPATVSIEGRFIINEHLNVTQCCNIPVLNLETAVLEALPKVEDDCTQQPVAGWPILTAIWLQDQNGLPVSVGEDLTAYVQFKELGVDGCLTDCAAKCLGKVDYLTWDTALKPDGEQICFNQKGAFRGYADKDIATGALTFPMGCDTCKLDWDTFVHPYCNKKTYIWIYPNWDDKDCLKSAAGKTVEIVVTLKRPDGSIVTTNNQILTFASPVELTRFMDSETWQTISTPKYLANPADCTKYGTFADLLEPGSWKVIVEYDETQGWIPRSGSDIVEPLKCYWVKTTQPLCPVQGNSGRQNYWLAKYIFARASDMSDSLPPVRTLNPGWNSVGMAVSAAYSNCCDELPGWWAQEDINMENLIPNSYRMQTGPCGGLDCMDYGCTVEADFIYRALGSICSCCKLVYNPGGAYGNLASWSTLAVSQGTAGAWWMDPEAPVFNGDNYWIYINDTCLTTDLAAGVGLEIVDP